MELSDQSANIAPFAVFIKAGPSSVDFPLPASIKAGILGIEHTGS